MAKLNPPSVKPVLIKVQRSGRINIPQRFCKLLDIKPGDLVSLRVLRGSIIITPDERLVARIIQEAGAEEKKNPMSVEDRLSETDRLARYGEKQAKKLGIKPKDINRIIHKHRKAQRV